MEDEKTHHGAMDESSSKQQFHLIATFVMDLKLKYLYLAGHWILLFRLDI